ncbi:MAG: isochorismatase family protein [Actinomycetota bacterium]
MSAAKLDPERSALVVIDVQEGFRKAVPSFDQVAQATAALVKGAKAVGIPIVVTEQYPKGLGNTAPEVAEELPSGVTPIEKVCFSAPEAEGFDLDGREQALVCGIEAHVCVNQTTLDLLDEGVEVHVARDAVGSRSEGNLEVGLTKAERAGAVITSVETALFELVGRAGTEEFKRVQKVVLDYAPNPS